MPHYAIVQQSLDPPTTDQLIRAFEAVPELTRGDAIRLCRTAFGIIVRGRTLDTAKTLQRALREEGVPTWVVAQDDLPALKPAKPLRKAAIREGGLVASDLYGREQVTPWACFGVAAAGSFTEQETERRLTRSTAIVSLPTTGAGIYGGSFVVHRTKITYEHHERGVMLLDLFMDRAPHRWRIESTRFNYESLGDRRTPHAEENFNRFATDLLGRVPHVAMNMGAAAIAQTPDDIFRYPSRDTFEEELTWLFWQAGGMRGGVG